MAKSLSQNGCKIFKKLVDQLNGETSCRIDTTNGVYMPLHVEDIGYHGVDRWRVISLAHYGKQHGDLMCDPEMTFLVLTNYDESLNVYPMSYRNDWMNINNEALFINGSGITGTRPKMQREMAAFANTWMTNINQQQTLPRAKKKVSV